MIEPELYESFSNWLDNLLENNEMPESTAAFNFNLYDEESEGLVYAMQLIASDRFDPDDETGEWACYNIWSSEEDLFMLDFSDEEDQSFEHIQEIFTEFVNEYLENGKYKDILLGAKGIGIGHVDGDLDIIYKAEQ